jgi:hypothetical protein
LIGITQSERLITMAAMPGIPEATRDKVLEPTSQCPPLRNEWRS